MSDDLKQRVFDYLYALRDSGVTNMFGAGPFVSNAFGLPRDEARTLVVEWMKSFDEAKK